MPLNPQAKGFLEQLSASGAPPLHALSVEQSREIIVQLFAVPGEPEPVGAVVDRTIDGAAGELRARVYSPCGSGPFPLLVFFHGGGWVFGNLAAYDATCRALTNAAGCVVVAMEYRLAPEHRFPAAPEDCYAALQWVAAHAAEIGGDPTRIAVGGDSAGGNLATVVAALARDRHGPALRFQLLIYPVTDHDFDTASYRENADGYLLTRQAMMQFWDHYLPNPAERDQAMASPLRSRNLQGLPPALVLTAECDPLRDEGEAYAARLSESGVAVSLKRYPGMIHGFFSLSSAIPSGKQAIQDAGAALRRAFAT